MCIRDSCPSLPPPCFSNLHFPRNTAAADALAPQMPGAEPGDRGERGEGADGAKAVAGGPEHDRVAEEGDREGVEDGGRVAREGAARQGDHPAAQA
eukprot:2101795-Rhodomonas_salina.1